MEYWPNHFPGAANVILRRDVAYAETGAPHPVGVIQSFSYWPYPRSNRSAHEHSQSDWLAEQRLQVVKTWDALYFDTYYFHYRSVEDVMRGKPWALHRLQLLNHTRTLYIGGCAAYETVEDTFQSTLQLVHDIFDAE